MKRTILLSIILTFTLIILSCVSPGYKDPSSITFPPLGFEIPRAERVKLKNGIILYILEDHELPLVSVSSVIRTGSVYDPEGLEGLAGITGAVMRTGGTEEMSADEVDEALDFIAADLSVSIGRESGTANLSVLRENLDEGLHIFSDILIRPSFEREKLETAKGLAIENLRRMYDNPQRYAFREFTRFLYQGDPRGRLSSEETIRRIERENVLSFYRRFFHPENVMMAVTGDITKEEALSIIGRYFNEWKIGGQVSKIAPPSLKEDDSVYYIYKDIPQSVIVVGRPAPGKKSDDYYAFEILDFIAGSGGFQSRIFSEVRNNLGLAYSAGSFYSAKTEFGIFGFYAMANSTSTARVLSAIDNILENIRGKGVGDDEFRLAGDSLVKSFIFSFETPAEIAVRQMMLEY
ncbi:MAG: pitrilysin family protein, partial [Thermodesulfobacteriota bacterium]|nr:pitrilysin family protein [Thermodesulfobacteriota bacterium]